MKHLMMAAAVALAAAPAAFAKDAEAPDLAAAYTQASGIVVASADEDAKNVNTRIEPRTRVIGERELSSVGECYHSATGNFLDKYAFKLTYKQKVESYLVEVKSGRGMFNNYHSESVVPGSQKEAVQEFTEEQETANLSSDSDDGKGACEAMRKTYVDKLNAAAK